MTQPTQIVGFSTVSELTRELQRINASISEDKYCSIEITNRMKNPIIEITDALGVRFVLKLVKRGEKKDA